jgi:CRISPR-associated protein Cas1
MIDRVLEIADSPAHLSIRDCQLVIAPDGAPTVTTPVSELAVLVVTHPRVGLTQSVIAGIAKAGGSIVICDEKCLPAAMLLPMQAHFIQTERYAAQAQMKAPLRKQLWRQLVRAKIRAQARLLSEIHGTDSGLAAMADRVLSGDTTNIEAQAARRYWPLLFNDPKFRRGREGPDQNAHLNYGYTVLRAVVARAVCGAGLHPSLGLQHHNRYDQFSLASDFMEPLRPLVDRRVALWIKDNDPAQPLGREAKAWLLRIVQDRYSIDGELRTLFDVVSRSAASLARAISGEEKILQLPEV